MLRLRGKGGFTHDSGIDMEKGDCPVQRQVVQHVERRGENRRPRYLNVGLKCSSEDPNEGINKPPKSQIAANVQVLEKECG